MHIEYKITKSNQKKFNDLPERIQKEVMLDTMVMVLRSIRDRLRKETQRWRGTARNSITEELTTEREGRVFSRLEYVPALVHGRKASRIPFDPIYTWARSKGFPKPKETAWKIWRWRNSAYRGAGIHDARTLPGPEGWGGVSNPKVPSNAWKEVAQSMQKTIRTQFTNALKRAIGS